MDILKELWCGNIRPQESAFAQQKGSDDQLRRLIAWEEKLTAMLGETERACFEQYQRSQDDLALWNESESFAEGVRLGARLMLACLTQNGGCL